MNYNDITNVELYLLDLCDQLKPKSCAELETLAMDLHECVERAISEFITFSDELNLDDYTPQY